MVKVSALVNTLNEAHNIERCLRSLQWCDEIIVVDMNSEDGTADIARGLGAKVIQTDMRPGFADPARNLGLDVATGDWMFQLDADEELSQACVPELLRLANEGRYALIKLPRRNLWWGKWLRHMAWPDYQPRFFRAGSLRYGSVIHYRDVAFHSLPTYLLPLREEYAITHYVVNNLDVIVERAVRYSIKEADWMINQEIHYSIWRHLRALAGTAYTYTFRYPFWKDQLRGFHAFSFFLLITHLNWVRLWERENEKPREIND